MVSGFPHCEYSKMTWWKHLDLFCLSLGSPIVSTAVVFDWPKHPEPTQIEEEGTQTPPAKEF